ncbi:transcriptional regulator [Undibacterium sp. KW1]|uniref:AraC family transcriptional regulator n=1 Tax=Undibacterium sp. KW1 TaxID=2058624 RepID=UPI001331DBAA|nr:AraC family transcriptional regulator [Undibacterium sp. KW1]BBB60575.1 transcriptional regulator [Undibacterium sp. KW1]
MPNSHTGAIAGHHTNGRVAAAYLQPLLELVNERSLNLRTLATMAGMAEDALSRWQESIAAADYIRLLDAGAELSIDPHFGLHVGERVKLGTYNVYGMILMSCKDFEQAFQQTMRYEGLAHDLGRSALVVDDAMTEYQWHSHYPQASRHLVESVFAGIRVFGNWFAGTILPDAPVYFRHAAPDDLSEHHRLFGQEVHFEAIINCARFPTALLGWPVPNADVSMYPVLQHHAELLLKQKQQAQQDGGIVAQVRAAISNNLAQDQARLPLIAQELLLSQRTLQRKLSEAGISFQQILDRTRKDMAIDYLQQTGFSLADIAFLLGYQEQSAFNHAFKEWTGVSPGAYREKHQRRK